MKSSLVILHRRRSGDPTHTEETLALRHLVPVLLIAFAALAIIVVGITYAVISKDFPAPEVFGAYYAERSEPTRFYDRSGKNLLLTLAYDGISPRDLSLCEVDGEGCFPEMFVRAVTPEEDSLRKITAEMVAEVYADDLADSPAPKLISFLLERQVRDLYGDEQILSFYLNRAWFGQLAFGADAAAQLYLNKPADQMNDAECILLSAILRSPSLNPIDSHGAVKDSFSRQVIHLLELGVIGEGQLESLAEANFVIYDAPPLQTQNDSDIILRKALNSAYAQYGREKVQRGGYTFLVSEDRPLQEYLNCVVHLQENTDEDGKDLCPLYSEGSGIDAGFVADVFGKAPVSAVIMDATSGQLLAAVEAESTPEGERTSRNVSAVYDAGSNMDIFTALAAFSLGSTPADMYWDLETVDAPVPEDYRNPDGKFHGPVRLRQAVTGGLERPMSSLLTSIGTSAVTDLAGLFGIRSFSDPSRLLYDGVQFTAEEFAFALQPLANNGNRSGVFSENELHPVSILRVFDRDGRDVTRERLQQNVLLSDGLAYLITNVLSGEEQTFALIDRPAATKIGRIYNSDSRWVSGYTPQYVCAVHVGEENTRDAFIGGDDRVEQAAILLWRSLMLKALEGKPAVDWEIPDSVNRVKVCLPSGKLPTAVCPETITEVFLSGTEPYEADDFYVEKTVNRDNRLLATRYTPNNRRESAVFMDLPDFAASWARENHVESVPKEYDPIREQRETNGITIFSPSDFSLYESGTTIEVKVDLDLDSGVSAYQVSSGSEMYPEGWVERCSGEALENGKWLLCSIDPVQLESGLTAIRVGITLDSGRYVEQTAYIVTR